MKTLDIFYKWLTSIDIRRKGNTTLLMEGGKNYNDNFMVLAANKQHLIQLYSHLYIKDKNETSVNNITYLTLDDIKEIKGKYGPVLIDNHTIVKLLEQIKQDYYSDIDIKDKEIRRLGLRNAKLSGDVSMYSNMSLFKRIFNYPKL